MSTLLEMGEYVIVCAIDLLEINPALINVIEATKNRVSRVELFIGNILKRDAELFK